jgi:hypothetical protein
MTVPYLERRASALAAGLLLRVEHIAQPVAEKVEAEHGTMIAAPETMGPSTDRRA